MPRPRLDPITLSIVWTNMIAIAEEMGVALKRTAFSPALREAGDFSASIHDARGRLVAHGLFTPGHTGAAIRGVPQMLSLLDRSDLAPGDALLYNDLTLGLGHLPDMFSVAPIFWHGQIIAYSVTSAHHVDLGGPAPGSLAIEGVRDVYAEGLRITPIKYFVGGEPNPDVFALIKANSRLADRVEGDLHAQMNANRRGTKRLIELIDRYSAATVGAAMDQIMLNAEQSMRRSIRSAPNGRFEFEDQLDDFGPGTAPVQIKVALEINDDTLSVDFAGTSPQVAAGLNSYFGFTIAYTYFALKAALDPATPGNDGSLRPISITAPPGCFLNPLHPAPGGGRAVALTRIVDTVVGALAQAVPDAVAAAPSQFMNSAFGGDDGTKSGQFVYLELLFGGTGARPSADGSEAMCSALDIRNIPVEVYESTAPLRVERFELIADSGGPGRYRGGCGVRKDIRVLTDSIVLTNMGDRTASAPYGLAGGSPGAVGASVLESGETRQELASKGTYLLNQGDLVSLRLSGGGGYGDPFSRDPALVAADLREGYVTEASAASTYGVCFRAGTTEIDPDSTQTLRAAAQPLDSTTSEKQ